MGQCTRIDELDVEQRNVADRIIAALKEQDDITFDMVSQHTGLSTEAIREPLRALVQDGYVKMKDGDHDWDYRLRDKAKKWMTVEEIARVLMR